MTEEPKLVRPPWVTEEEFSDMTAKRCFGTEGIPGTPEGDTSRFYTNEAHTEWIDINYDEAKAGIPGVDFTLEDPLTFADGRKVASAADWAARRRKLLAIVPRRWNSLTLRHLVDSIKIHVDGRVERFPCAFPGRYSSACMLGGCPPDRFFAVKIRGFSIDHAVSRQGEAQSSPVSHSGSGLTAPVASAAAGQ